MANFDRVAYRLPPPFMPEFPNSESNERIDSRESIMNHIIEALRSSSVNVIGLCGPGGVGKTTIAKEVELKGKNQKMFEKVIWATVSDKLNVGKIQRQIAEKLGMSLNEETEDLRACSLWKRLEQEKNMLLILDDLWEELDLCKVGIPLVDVENCSKNNEYCKILLTSRNEMVLLNGMKCQKLIKVDILSDDEALKFFKGINATLSSGSSSRELTSIATEIVQKCRGLPLAIATAAKALQENDVDGWKDYLARWKNYLARRKNHLRRYIIGYKEVDVVLKLSYDPLSRENKDIFLLSALLSHNPSVLDLLMYSMGLGFLQDIENIEEAHLRIRVIVRMLKSLNLFLDSFSSNYFTMHDLYRDTALSIASVELCALIVRHRMLEEWPEERMLECCKGIFLEESDISVELPKELEAPRLHFFMLHSTKRDLIIPNTFFRSSKQLKLLAFTNLQFSLLPSLSYLQKLKVLCMHSCVLEDIVGVKSLKKLEVLSLAYSEIKRLPGELAELTCLQMLNLSHCFKLEVIPEKLLSSFKKLEVLYMENSFNQWKVEGSSETNENASLDELKDLPISFLDIHIPNVSMLPKKLLLDMNLKRYKILIGKNWQWKQHNHETSKILKLEVERGIHLKHGIQRLLNGVEDLYLHGFDKLDNILFSDKGRGFPYLRHLKIKNNDDIKCIVLNSTGHETTFPILESLILQDLKALEKLYEGMNTIAFDHLRTLRMRNLPALTADPCLKDGGTSNVSNKMFRSLFSKVLLPKLEILELCNINNLIPFIWDDQLSHNSLSNLKTLVVKRCGFVKLLPLHVLNSLNNLEELEIEECRMLKMVFDFEDLNDYEETEPSLVVVPLKKLKLRSLPKLENLWCSHYQRNVSFPRLRSVYVSMCERLTSIFPASFIVKGMLRNLEELQIYECGIDVIVADDQALESANFAFKFPRLTSLELNRLRKLRNFYPKRHTLEWPNLKRLSIEDCGELEIFVKEASGSLEIHMEEGMLNSSYPLLSCDQQVVLPNLEILELSNLLNNSFSLIRVEQLSHNSLSKLKTLVVKECGFVKLLPFHVLKSLNNLEELEIGDCRMMTMVFDFEDLNYYKDIESLSVVVPLKTLKLWCLPKLENVWSSHYQGNVSFPNLRSVKVSNCESLTSIFPASFIVEGMLRNLEKLRISECGIDVIVANDQASESANVAFKFPRLTSLELRDLVKLRNFYMKRHMLECPNLLRLSIEYCGELEIFEKEASGSLEIQMGESTLNSNHPLLSCGQVIPNLEELELRGRQAMINYLFPMYQFPKVKMLSLFLYDESIISYKSLCKSFPNLEQLQLGGAFEVSHETDVTVASFSSLTLSRISNMRNLSPYLVSSQNLTHLQVNYSNELTTLMTSTIAQCLVHLTRLSVDSCYKMKEIITKQEGENEDKEIIFSKLKVLEFGYMPELKRFCGYNYTFKFPFLEHIVMERCPKFKLFSPGNIDTSSLESVQIDWGTYLEIQNNLNETFYQQRFVASRKVVLDKEDASMIRNVRFTMESFPQVQFLGIEGFVDDEWVTMLERFPGLKELHVEDCFFEDIFPSRSPSLASFHNLIEMMVSKCHQLLYLVTNLTRKSFVKLETLQISDCDRLKEIVKKETEEDVERGGIIFNGLKMLKLENLPRLKTDDFDIQDRATNTGFRSLFGHNEVVFPKLEILELSKLLNNSISLIWVEQLSHNSFSNLKTLIVQSCGSLKSVPIHVLKSLNNLDKLQVSECHMLETVFDFEDLNDCNDMESTSVVVPLNLTNLKVKYCQGLTTLMTSSAARSLAHLTHLSVKYCNQIKEIITKQGEEDEEDMQIVFSKLEILELCFLTRLKRFCSHNYTFSFPLLEVVTIRECPQLTMFCPGATYAPLLKRIQDDNLYGRHRDIWMTDLNDTIQHRFTIKEVISNSSSMALNAENFSMIKDVFPKVTCLYVKGFMDEGVTFPYSSLKRFPQLSELFVEHCSFEEIFPSHNHSTYDFMEKIPPFKQLRIANLGQLKSIWKDDSQLLPIHQNLIFLEVKSCCKLLMLAPSFASFQYLWKIKVSGCHQLIHLVTSSTAKSLVNLERLEINDCKNMEAIVMNVTNEDVELAIIFNQLSKIKLANMPSLKMFSSQSHNFKFPKLKELEVTECPEMNMFLSMSVENTKVV